MVGVGEEKEAQPFYRKEEDKRNDSDNNGEAPRSQALAGWMDGGGTRARERQRQEESI